MAWTVLVTDCNKVLLMTQESPVTFHKVTYRGSTEYQLKWTEGGEARESHHPDEAEAVTEMAAIEERLRVAALAGQGLTVNPFGMHLPFITSKDVHYAALKLQPRKLKFREVIDDYVEMVTVLKPYETTPQQVVFEWLELKKQIGDRPLYEVLKVYLQATLGAPSAASEGFKDNVKPDGAAG